jgi:hypothetical protein
MNTAPTDPRDALAEGDLCKLDPTCRELPPMPDSTAAAIPCPHHTEVRP